MAFFGTQAKTPAESAASLKVSVAMLEVLKQEKALGHRPYREIAVWQHLAAFLAKQPEEDWPLLIGAIAASLHTSLKPGTAMQEHAAAA